MENRTSYSKVIKDSAFNLINTVILAGFNILLSIIVARQLEPTLMGNYSFIIWLSTSLSIILSFGLPNGLLRYGAEIKVSHNDIVTLQLFRKVLFIGLVIGLGWCLPIFFASKLNWVEINIPLLSSNIQLIIPGFLVITFHSLTTSYAKSQRDYRRLIFVNTFSYTFILFATIIIAITSPTVNRFVSIYFSGFALIIICLLILYRIPIRSNKIPQPLQNETWNRMFRYSVSVVFILMIDMVVWQRSEIFFMQYFGQYDQIAFYNIAYDLSSKSMRLISASLPAVLLPVFAGLYGKSDLNKIKIGYEESTKYLALLSFPLAASLFIFSKPIIVLIYGQDYAPVVPVFQILIIAASLGVIAGAGSSVIHAMEKQSFILVSGALIAIINIIGNLFMIPRFGSIGGAFSNSLSQSLGVILGICYIVLGVKLKFPFGSIFRILISTMIMSSTMYIIITRFDSAKGLILAAIFGFLIFVGTLAILDFRRNEFGLIKYTMNSLQHRMHDYLKQRKISS